MLYWRISSDLFCVWQILSIHGDNNTVLTFFALHLFNTAIKPYSRHTAMQNPPHTQLAPWRERKTKQVGKMFVTFGCCMEKKFTEAGRTYIPSPNSSLMMSLMLSP
jgi:hypothetical protein